MILPDINLLVYAHNVSAPSHDPARVWWEGCLNGTEGIALPWVVILGFVRITTQPRIFPKPLSPTAAAERVQEWLDQPHVFVLNPATNHFRTLSSLLIAIELGGNLTTDAHLAALAIETGYTLNSTDTDFARFPGLKWVNPLD